MRDIAAIFFFSFLLFFFFLFLFSDGTVDEIYAMDTMIFAFLRFSCGYIY